MEARDTLKRGASRPDVLPPRPDPAGRGWQFEPKWDGFRALVSTIDGFP